MKADFFAGRFILKPKNNHRKIRETQIRTWNTICSNRTADERKNIPKSRSTKKASKTAEMNNEKLTAHVTKVTITAGRKYGERNSTQHNWMVNRKL
jgi:hypothetical protein